MKLPANKTRTIVIVISILLVLGTGVFLYLYDKKKITGTSGTSGKTSNPGTPSTGTGTSGNSNSGSSVESGFPLKEGSRGTLVKTLQTALNKTAAKMFLSTTVRPRYNNQNLEKLVVDGIFGPRTLAFVTFVFSDFTKKEISSNDLNKISWN